MDTSYCKEIDAQCEGEHGVASKQKERESETQK